MAKLTDKTAFGGTLADEDLLHLVDVSDTTQDPEGSSYKLSIAQLFGGRLTYGNIALVAEYTGADTGIAGRWDRPFKSWITAEAAISAGDTVIGLPGTYSDADIGKNGVLYHAFDGVKISAATTVWRDTAGTMSYSVSGFGEYICTGTGGGAFLKVVVDWKNAGTLNMQAKRISSANSGANATILVRGGGVANITIHESIINSNGDAIRMNDSSSVLTLRCPKIYSENLTAFSTQGGSAEIYGNLYAPNYYAVGAYGGDLILNGKTAASSVIYNQSGASRIIFNGDVSADDLEPANGSGGGSAYIEFNGNVNAAVDIDSHFTGTLIFNKKLYSSLAAMPVINQDGGTVFVCSYLENGDTGILCHGINYLSGTLVLDGAVIKCANNTDAEAVHVVADKNVFVYKNTVGNRPMGAGVTLIGGGSYNYDTSLTYPMK